MWVRDGPIGHRNGDFFAPASVMYTFWDHIGHRHEKLAPDGDAEGAEGAEGTSLSPMTHASRNLSTN
jgi:hypothetical protein